MRAFTLLIMSLFAGTSLAQTSEVVPAPAPRWSLGAGVAGSLSGAPVLVGLGAQGSYVPEPPAITASLERRLGSSWGLLLGVAARHEAIGSEGNQTAHRGVTLSLGLRRALTSPQAPAELSVFAAVRGGRSWTEVTSIEAIGALQPLGTSNTSNADWRTLGLLAGVSVERVLLAPLSVRLSASLMSAEIGARHSEGVLFALQPADQTFSRASLIIVPLLELRFAF